MKIVLALFLLCYLGIEGSCQQLGLFTGYCANEYYDRAEENPYFQSSYKKGNGGSVGIKIEQFRIIDKLRSDTFHLSMALKLATYTGDFKIYDGGRGSSQKLNLRSTKYLLGVEIIPFNKKIYNELRFSIGADINFLIVHIIEGDQVSWMMNAGSAYKKLDTNDKQFNKPVTLGVNFNVQYNLKISEILYLTPAYSFYWGLTNEFEDCGAIILSNRHCFNIGIAKRLVRRSYY